MSLNPAILGASDWDSGSPLSGVASPSAKQVGVFRTIPSIHTTDPPPPEEGWPDPFMSYPLSAPIILDGVDGDTISYKSFQDVRRDTGNPRPITLLNCNNITIERIDTRGCTMGLLYAQNCTNITVRYCRVENYAYEFIDQTLNWDQANAGTPGYFANDNDCNVFQINGADQFHANDIKARYGNNEDAFSFYNVTNSTATRIQYEGCITDSRPTSDGRRSTYWTSGSGTAFILGDSPGAGGFNLTVTDSSFIDSGQVGPAIACGYNNTFDNCVMIGTGDPPDIHPETGNLNVGCYISPQAEGCAVCENNAMTNMRIFMANRNGSFIECAGSNTSGSNFDDTSLNVEDYRVTL